MAKFTIVKYTRKSHPYAFGGKDPDILYMIKRDGKSFWATRTKKEALKIIRGIKREGMSYKFIRY